MVSNKKVRSDVHFLLLQYGELIFNRPQVYSLQQTLAQMFPNEICDTLLH